MLILLASPLHADPRYQPSGNVIPDESYCDQPYVVITKDGNWLCVLTTGKKHEGQLGQHVVSTISKDQGKTWGPLVDIEPETGPEASWVVPLVVPSGRVYAFYTFNGDRVSTMPGSPKKIRADMLGWYGFKYSDDNGQTWSEQRYRIPLRVTDCDKANQWKGEVQIFWGIDKPKVSEMGVTFAITKLGKYMLDNGEGWMVHSDNLLTERDPNKINWRLLPDGENGLRMPQFGSVQEEHNHVFIGAKEMYLAYRNKTGYPCHTYSRDGGKTWTEPVHMTYSPDGRRIKTPRACPKLFQCKNGKYLFWFHNHSGKTFYGRNPVWVTGGVVKEGKMHWSEPEILLYHHDLKGRGMSYPDLIEQDGRYWVTETQKADARVHLVDPALLEGMWAQHEDQGQVAQKGLVLNLDEKAASASEVKTPRLADLSKNGGFAIDLTITFKDNGKQSQLVLDSRDDQGRGIAIGVDQGGSINVYFADGNKVEGRWASDPGLLKEGRKHHITAIVDGGPNIITIVVDGKLCDGGESRQFGWGRFDPKTGDVNGSDKLRLAPSFDGKIHRLRIYDRYLRISEAVGNYKVGVAGEESKRQILMGGCGLGKILIVDENKAIVWEVSDPCEASDVWLLEDGAILHSAKDGFQKIQPNYELGKGAKRLWRVDAPKGSECHSCQPIGEDRYLVGYSSKDRSYLAEVNSKGEEIKVVEVEGQIGKHSSFRQVRKTKAGTYLTSQQKGGGKAREYSAEGKLIRTFPSGRYGGMRLENGNTLLSCGDEHRLIEVDAENKIVWELKQGDLDGVKLGFIAGFCVLKNGNILFTNWGGHGGSTGGAVIEITREKKLVSTSGTMIKNRVSSLFVKE